MRRLYPRLISVTAKFSLTKWYADCVTLDGRVSIAYWGALRWRSLSLGWASISLHEAGRTPRHRLTLRPGPPPEMRDDVLKWRTSLCRADLAPSQPRIDELLYDSADGAVAWQCVAPVARASMRGAGGTTLDGVGYGECLTLTIPPWRLPISELRWGRWGDADARHSLVWIDWRGATTRTWVFVNGQRAQPATVSDSAVCAGGVSLSLSSPRVLLDRDLGEVLRKIRPLDGIIPSRLHDYHESKWTSSGILTAPGQPPLTGQTMHEVVRFA